MLKQIFIEPNKIYNVDETQLEILKEKIKKLSSLSKRLGVAPPEITIHKTEPVYSNIYPEYTKDRPTHRTEHPVKNIYSISVSGEIPKMEGYEFVARIHHQPEGNLIFKNPGFEGKLPRDLENLAQRCDLCHTNRDRINTFIFIMEKENEKLFPEKKPGDFLVIGSHCVESFFPGGNLFIETINQYETLIQDLNDFDESSREEKEDDLNYPKTFKAEIFLEFLIGSYLEHKEYISISIGKTLLKTPTVDRAYEEMFPPQKIRFIGY